MGRLEINLADGYLTEHEILTLKNRLSKGIMKLSEFPDLLWDEGYMLYPDQTEKGLAWLKNQWKTPMGKERKHNPFGYRETAAIESFKEFRLCGFQNTATYAGRNMGFNFYVPIYRVVGEKSQFEYYVSGGKTHIVG